MEFSYKASKFSAKLVSSHSHVLQYEVYEYDSGEVIAEGSIKFDGCSNWDFKTDDTLIHFCGMSDLSEFYHSMEACYGHAKRHFETRGQWYDF